MNVISENKTVFLNKEFFESKKMNIYAISDLHLSLARPKPMEVFGPLWKHHHLKINENWEREVSKEDFVLVCGDISWAITLEEVLPDLNFIDRLPGKKVLVRGNHDYWWKSISKVRRLLPASIQVLQNDAIILSEGIAICGSRGWVCPGKENFNARDLKIYQRELQRMEMSLQTAQKFGARKIIVMIHYPPFNNFTGEYSDFEKLFCRFGVIKCVYGHLHAGDQRYAFNGVRKNIEYQLVACDYLNFKPLKVFSYF